MTELSFLKQVLTSNCEYWIAARQEYSYGLGECKRAPDSVWLIAIPGRFKLDNQPYEILVDDVEKLLDADVQNIAISKNYAPFQDGITMRNFYIGFPIKLDVKEFLRKIINQDSKHISDYKKILDEMQAEEDKKVTHQPQTATV